MARKVIFGFDADRLLESGALGEVDDYAVRVLAGTSIRYAKGFIESSSTATLIVALRKECGWKNPRKGICEPLAKEISKRDDLKQESDPCVILYGPFILFSGGEKHLFDSQELKKYE